MKRLFRFESVWHENDKHRKRFIPISIETFDYLNVKSYSLIIMNFKISFVIWDGKPTI